MAGAREEERHFKKNDRRDFNTKRKNSFASKNKDLHTNAPPVSATATSPTTPTSVGSTTSNASFSSGSPNLALPSLRPTPEHVPVNNFNSQEVEAFLNSGWKEEIDRFYNQNNPESEKPEMYKSEKAWGKGVPAWGQKPHLMANGNDFFNELRKSSPNVQVSVSNAQPTTAK
ncbi:12299_t:CDS:2 [Acaulospora colombiana]|uniref:12299_t:CDS:1 n=1 Tax=Acaulospora colombiana TaxID=27376 RepID=A0ACA9MXF2_9GLOM|nr:12299_t:CDS:2 [Acaulospora colombiana]